MATCAAGLFLGYLVAGEWLTGIKRASAPFLLALIPFYNFHGLKFDQNSALIPLWALTLLAFVRSYRTGSAAWGALAGFAAAAAVLTKYWSVFLILGLAVAALADRGGTICDPRRRGWRLVSVRSASRRMCCGRSRLPDFDPRDGPAGRVVVAIPPKGYAGIPGRYDRLCGPGDRRILVTVRPDLAAWKDIARLKEDDRRFGRNALLATLLLPIAFAAFAKIAMLSLWSAPLYTFLPAVLLSSPLVRMTREHAIRIAVVSICSRLRFTFAGSCDCGMGACAWLRAARTLRPACGGGGREGMAGDDAAALVAAPFLFVDSVAFYIADKPLTFSGFSLDSSKNHCCGRFPATSRRGRTRERLPKMASPSSARSRTRRDRSVCRRWSGLRQPDLRDGEPKSC